MDQQSIKNIINAEVSADKAQKAAATARQVQETARKAAAFNQASQKAEPIRKALKDLEAATGGKIQISQERLGDSVHFVTNIPAKGRYGSNEGQISVSVFDDGRVIGYGDSRFDYYGGGDTSLEFRTKAGKRHADEKVVKFVTQYAVKKGMLP